MRIGPSARFWAGILSLLALNLGLWLVMWVVVASVLFGLEPTAVTSGSMRPRVEVGDVVMLQASDGRDLGKGTVIRFEHDRPATLHRITDVRADGSYVTMGDANSSADQATVRPESVRGVGVLLVPLVGSWFLARDQDPVKVVVITALVVLVLMVSAAQALDPANDPWLSSVEVPRRLAARVTASAPVRPADHLLGAGRLAGLRADVDRAVARLDGAESLVAIGADTGARGTPLDRDGRP